MAQTNRKKPGIEESFQELDDVIAQMEEEDCPLEKSFALYEKGIGLVKHLNESIERVEKKLKVINDEASDTEE